VSALPLLGACVAAGGGRYTGLAVRRERKAYGSCRQIDGPVDRARSVVVLDESITAGRSVYEGIRVLESEGLEVEGALCLVEFAGYGAVAWLEAAGYRVETVFNVWEELDRRAVTPRHGPSSIDAPRTRARLPEGLSPAELARAVAIELRRSSGVPPLPESLDQAYDSSGGTFVSVRRRRDDLRLTRAGFRRDGELPADVARDVAIATVQALDAPAVREIDLDDVKFSVSLLGEPEPIEPRQIDHKQYGLIVRGIGPLDRVGVALPNAPHYDDEVQQYRYARMIAARFSVHEPTGILRQTVRRDVEPGESWPPYGAIDDRPSLLEDVAFATALAERLRRRLQGSEGGPPLVSPLDEPISAIGVSLYHDGIVACSMSFLDNLDDALAEATARALEDRRFGDGAEQWPANELTAVVSLLGRQRNLGVVADDRLRLFYRLGKDTLMASAGQRSGLILAHFAVEQSTETEAYRRQVLTKAGVKGGQVNWTAWETMSWRVGPDGPAVPLDHGFPAPVAGRSSAWPLGRSKRLARDLAGFVLAQRLADGLPAYYLQLWNGRIYGAGPAARILLTLAALLEAEPFLGRRAVRASHAMLDAFVVGGQPASPRAELSWDRGSDAQLLATLGLVEWDDEHEAAVDALLGRLRPLVRGDGAVYHEGARRVDADLDILSGIVLLGLARVAPRRPEILDDLDLEQVLAFYRCRFSLLRPWSMVWWHTQAWAALDGKVDGAGDFAFELADWALARQSDTSGAFVIDSLPPHRASFLTACVLEAVAATWELADERGDRERAERHERAWEHGMSYVDRLVIRPDDTFFSPAAGLAAGGVRASLVSSDVRIDFVGHALLALVKGLRARERGNAVTTSPGANRSPGR
jgi:AMMECR1 domain-containing protein